jgi:tetratricopeptide (TPR) repeat protein
MNRFCSIWVVAILSVVAAAQSQSLQERQAAIEMALQSGDPTAALQLANQSLTRWPGDPRLLHLRGLAYFRSNQLAEAERDLTAAQKATVDDADIAFDLGLLYMAQRRYEEAAKRLERAMKDPGRERAGLPHLLLGRAYQNSNRSELAIREFKTALKKEPDLKMGHFHLGYAYESVGRNREAIAEYEEELKGPASSAEVHYQYAHLLLEAGALEKSETHLRQVLGAQPAHADAQYDLGKVLLLRGKAAEAVTELRKAIALQPDSASAYFQLAKALSKTGDPAGAKEASRRFAELKAAQQAQGGMATGRIR